MLNWLHSLSVEYGEMNRSTDLFDFLFIFQLGCETSTWLCDKTWADLLFCSEIFVVLGLFRKHKCIMNKLG